MQAETGAATNSPWGGGSVDAAPCSPAPPRQWHWPRRCGRSRFAPHPPSTALPTRRTHPRSGSPSSPPPSPRSWTAVRGTSAPRTAGNCARRHPTSAVAHLQDWKSWTSGPAPRRLLLHGRPRLQRVSLQYRHAVVSAATRRPRCFRRAPAAVDQASAMPTRVPGPRPPDRALHRRLKLDPGCEAVSVSAGTASCQTTYATGSGYLRIISHLLR